MSNNFNHHVENKGFTEQDKELDGRGANRNDQQCSWDDNESGATSPGNAQQQAARTGSYEEEDEEEEIERYIGPSYSDRVEQFLEKVFGGISSNTNNVSDRNL